MFIKLLIMNNTFFSFLLILFFTFEAFGQIGPISVSEYRNSNDLFKLIDTVLVNKGITNFELIKTSICDTSDSESLWKKTLPGYHYQSFISDQTISIVTVKPHSPNEQTKFNLFVFKYDNQKKWNLISDFSILMSQLRLQFWEVALMSTNILSVDSKRKNLDFEASDSILMDCKDENAPCIYIVSDEGYVEKYTLGSIQLNSESEKERGSSGAKGWEILEKSKNEKNFQEK